MTTKLSALTGKDNYFEDFEVGAVYAHARGKTVGETENVLITNLVMNSADAHFNEHKMKATPFGRRISYGGVNLSIVVGLAAQDTAEQAVQELGMDAIRFTAPVFHGDTLYAFTEVLEVKPAERDDVGEVRFKHWGTNQYGHVVCEGERRVLLKRRSQWAER